MKRLDDAYFERVYAKGPDPWGFESRWYEKRKYALTLAALPRERYRRAFEPGCANGVLTTALAARCDALVAIDPMPDVVARAKERVPGHVEVSVGALPEAFAAGTFDLVVASEVLYYLTREGFSQLSRDLETALEPKGHLVAVHWRGETDYPLRGDAVHALLEQLPFLVRQSRLEEEEFILEVFERSS